MKFYGKDGNVYNSRFKAMASGITKKANEFIDSKFPGAGAMFQTNSNIIDAEFYEDDLDNEFDDDDEFNDDEADSKHQGDDTMSESKDVVKHIEIDYARAKLYLVDNDGRIYASSDLDPKLVKTTIDSELFKVLYPDGNIPDDIQIVDITSPMEKSVKQQLDQYGITGITAHDLLSSSDPKSLLETNGASDEAIKNLTGNK